MKNLTKFFPRVQHVNRLAFTGILVSLIAISGATTALADDFQVLRNSAQTQKRVSIIVTGWKAITGDTVGANTDPTKGPVAISGDPFVEAMKQSSPNSVITRQFDNFNFLAMSVDEKGLEVAKGYSPTVQVWEDQKLETSLSKSIPVIHATAAWDRKITGRGATIAVIDTAFNISHPLFDGKKITEACFNDTCPNGRNRMVGPGAAQPNKINGKFKSGDHGTHVAGIALGNLKNTQLVGVAKEADLIAVSVFNKDGLTSFQNVAAALDYILTLEKKTPGSIGAINMSLGLSRNRSGICKSQIFDPIAAKFRALNIPIIVASGNDSRKGVKPVSFPACVKDFISVGAIDNDLKITPFSNSGRSLDLLAPGYNIVSAGYSADSRNCNKVSGAVFCIFPGTSMAAPHVAGAFALLKKASPKSSVKELLDVLKSTGYKITDGRNNVTASVINVEQALARLKPVENEEKRRVKQPRKTPEEKPNPVPPKKKEKVKKEPAPAPTPAPTPEAPKPEPKKKNGWAPITG